MRRFFFKSDSDIIDNVLVMFHPQLLDGSFIQDIILHMSLRIIITPQILERGPLLPVNLVVDVQLIQDDLGLGFSHIAGTKRDHEFVLLNSHFVSGLINTRG